MEAPQSWKKLGQQADVLSASQTFQASDIALNSVLPELNRVLSIIGSGEDGVNIEPILALLGPTAPYAEATAKFLGLQLAKICEENISSGGVIDRLRESVNKWQALFARCIRRQPNVLVFFIGQMQNTYPCLVPFMTDSNTVPGTIYPLGMWNVSVPASLQLQPTNIQAGMERIRAVSQQQLDKTFEDLNIKMRNVVFRYSDILATYCPEAVCALVQRVMRHYADRPGSGLVVGYSIIALIPHLPPSPPPTADALLSMFRVAETLVNKMDHILLKKELGRLCLAWGRFTP